MGRFCSVLSMYNVVQKQLTERNGGYNNILPVLAVILRPHHYQRSIHRICSNIK